MADVVAYWDETTYAFIPVSTAHPLPTTSSAPVSSPSNPVTSVESAVITSDIPVMVTVSVTRPTDTNAYAANDCWANDTATPTAGGFTITSAARVSGGAGQIHGVVVASSNDPAIPLQGELWIYDSAVTAINDNAAFAPAVADRLKLVGVVPFTLYSAAAGSGSSGSVAHVNNTEIDFTCSGSANLRFLVKVKNAYVPANAEVLTFRFKIRQLN